MPDVELATESLARQVEALTHGRPEARTQWMWYTLQVGKGIRDAGLLPADLVRHFIDAAARDSPMVVEMASEELVASIVKLQQNSSEANWLWHNWCAREGENTLDPRKLPADVPKRFLRLYDKGVFAHVELTSTTTANRIQDLQRRNSTFLAQWQTFCKYNTLGVQNPHRLPYEVVRFFLELHPDIRLPPARRPAWKL